MKKDEILQKYYNFFTKISLLLISVGVKGDGAKMATKKF